MAPVSDAAGARDQGPPAAGGCVAFSIDDSATTEIDDALSVQGLGTGTVVFGVHIAAPALAFEPESAIDKVARERLSTVYMPGPKLTMLPDEVVQAHADGRRRLPGGVAVRDGGRGEPRDPRLRNRLERVRIADNLRHDVLDAVITEASLTGVSPAGYAHAAELAFAFRLARHLKAGPRGGARQARGLHPARLQLSSRVGRWRAAGDEAVEIAPRRPARHWI